MPSQKMQNILFTTHLDIGYKSKSETNYVAKNINLNFEQGKLIAIIGENGIGKSTLLRTLTGIQKPLSGDVFLNNKNLISYSNIELAQNLSVVLTDKLPQSNLSVFEVIALGRQPYTNWIGKLSDDDLLQIEEAILLTDIAHLRNKKYHEISDGQLQIVLIARALAQDTPLIILDEPTTHLDLLHKVSLLKLLKKLAVEANKCIIYSTHDIDLAIQMSDEMVVFTINNITQDSPCKLIESGIFNSLFNDCSIVFDDKKGKFVINN